MEKGMERFHFLLTQLQELLTKAAQSPNPAEWLFLNNARTPLFHLESLARLYSNLHNRPMFMKIKERFKDLEDVLGQIDFYDYYFKEFSKKPEMPGIIIEFLRKRKEENLKLMNDILLERDWIGKKANRVDKIIKKIKDADWMKEKKEVNAIMDFYGNSIREINVTYNSAGDKFTELENQVHMLRRKLRWLSIYPQSLRGCIQLTDSKPVDDKLNKYLVDEIINSPFNKIPDARNSQSFLLLEKNYFLALSWMIAALGKLKDTGLAITASDEAMEFHKEHQSFDVEVIHNAAASGENLENILSKATNICKDYFGEKNLEKMVVSVSSVGT